MIQSSDAKIAERDLWLRKLMQGEITLHDALMMCLHLGVPSTPYLTARVEAAFQQYQTGVTEDLAVPFGMAMSKRQKNAMERQTWVSHVRFHVDAFYEQGLCKQDPSHYENTAFHAAAKLLYKSPTQIFDTYYGR